MFTAIIKLGAKQYRVQPGSVLYIEKIATEVGKTFKISDVLLSQYEGKELDYSPKSISAKVLEHGKKDKVIVFKKKRRKGYRRFKGHRQEYTKISIVDAS